jgi:muramoyltetrapeptide carboxypeptidase LdcA involved in peptidoglycan recycling
MSSRLQAQALALGLAAIVTAITLGALAGKADREYHAAAYAHDLLAQIENTPNPVVQQVVVTGHREAQQVVVIGRRRG